MYFFTYNWYKQDCIKIYQEDGALANMDFCYILEGIRDIQKNLLLHIFICGLNVNEKIMEWESNFVRQVGTRYTTYFAGK